MTYHLANSCADESSSPSASVSFIGAAALPLPATPTHNNNNVGGDCFNPLAPPPPPAYSAARQHKTLSVNESFSLPSLAASPATCAQRRGSARDAFSGALKELGDFELLEVLGEGFFGVVYKVKERVNPSAEPIVMKIPIMRDQPNLPPQSAKKIANKEDYMLTTALGSHPNILKSKGLCVQRTKNHWQLNLLIEFCDGGSLQQTILCPQKPMPWLQIAHTSLDICRAMAYVHGRGFLHRDLTSMNVLLKSQPPAGSSSRFPKAVVADFGLSTKIPDYPTVLQQVGTQNWMAPEVLKEQFYDEKVDVFSFGIILCQMIARIDADDDAGLYRTSDFGIDFVKFAEHKCPADAPMELLGCAFECCLCDASARPSFSELLHRFSTKIIAKLMKQNGVEEEEEKNATTTTNLASSHQRVVPSSLSFSP